MGWMGIVVPTVLALLLVARPRLWPYVLVAVAPGVALALSAPGTPSGTAPTLDWRLTLLATGTILALPIAALGWWWLHRPGARPGTLE